jgi:hypothetical protein
MLFVRAHLSSSPNDKLKDLYVSLIPIESSSSSIGSTRVYKIDKISSVFMVFDKIGLILFRFLNPRSVLDTCCSSTDRADASERCMMVRWAAGPALHRRRCACLANQQWCRVSSWFRRPAGRLIVARVFRTDPTQPKQSACNRTSPSALHRQLL